MRRILVGILALFLGSAAWAATCTFSSDGLWTTGSACAPPTIADTCTIDVNKTVWCNAATCACGTLTINGSLIMRPGARTLKIGNQTGSASADSITIATTGSLTGGPAHILEWNLARAGANEATNGVLTNNGRLVWKGRQVFTKGKISSVAAITGSAPSRTITLTDTGYTQQVADYWNGKYLQPTSGYFRHHMFEITTGGATANEIVVKVDNRGALDSRNVAGRVDPVAWAPGDWGAIISREDASADDATVASGGYIVTFSAGIFADVNVATDQLLGSRFICAADATAANDADFRRICHVNSATSATLCQTYGTASCAAGAGFRVYVDNQPPYAVALDETFKPCDTYEIIEPARMTLTSGRESDANPNNQYNIVANDGSTTELTDVLLDYCGFDGSTSGDKDCILVTEVDNDNTTEQFTITRAEIWHFQGEAAINLDGSDNVVIDRVNIHDAAEGGQQDGHEAHGILIGKSTTLANNITIKNSRITRTNDAQIGITGGAASDRGCADCLVTNNFFGFTPANIGGSPAFASTFPLDDLTVSGNFMTNSPGISLQTTSATAVTRATINGNLFVNLKSTTPPISGGTYTSTDLAHASNIVYFVNNAIIGSSGGFLRGWVIDNFIAALNPMTATSQSAIRDPQHALGNVVLGPPYSVTNVGDGLRHNPTSATISGFSPSTVIIRDNIVYTNISQTVNASCTASLAPWPCCTGSGTGTCNSASHYGLRADSSTGGSTTGYTFDHNTVIANDRYSSASQFGIGVSPSATASSVTNNIILDAERAIYQVAAGGGNMTCGYNLTMASFSGLDYTNGDPTTCTVPGNNNLNTGHLAFGRVDAGDASSAEGSTPWTSLGSDSTVRGVRVAGPPNPEYFRKLYASPLLLNSAGRAPGEASFSSDLIIIEIANTNTIGDRDTDGDGVWDTHDNCDRFPNPSQLDTDADGIGDRCE